MLFARVPPPPPAAELRSAVPASSTTRLPACALEVRPTSHRASPAHAPHRLCLPPWLAQNLHAGRWLASFFRCAGGTAGQAFWRPCSGCGASIVLGLRARISTIFTQCHTCTYDRFHDIRRSMRRGMVNSSCSPLVSAEPSPLVLMPALDRLWLGCFLIGALPEILLFSDTLHSIIKLLAYNCYILFVSVNTCSSGTRIPWQMSQRCSYVEHPRSFLFRKSWTGAGLRH